MLYVGVIGKIFLCYFWIEVVNVVDLKLYLLVGVLSLN